jgi:hypothetical protein
MKETPFEVDPKIYELIAGLIQSDGPVGIDAKKTHILILNKLQEITERLDRIEKQLAVK